MDVASGISKLCHSHAQIKRYLILRPPQLGFSTPVLRYCSDTTRTQWPDLGNVGFAIAISFISHLEDEINLYFLFLTPPFWIHHNRFGRIVFTLIPFNCCLLGHKNMCLEFRLYRVYIGIYTSGLVGQYLHWFHSTAGAENGSFVVNINTNINVNINVVILRLHGDPESDLQEKAAYFVHNIALAQKIDLTLYQPIWL